LSTSVESHFYLVHCHICSDRICSGLFQIISCAILLYHARSRKVIILICLMSSLFIIKVCNLIQQRLVIEPRYKPTARSLIKRACSSVQHINFSASLRKIDFKIVISKWYKSCMFRREKPRWNVQYLVTNISWTRARVQKVSLSLLCTNWVKFSKIPRKPCNTQTRHEKLEYFRLQFNPSSKNTKEVKMSHVQWQKQLVIYVIS